MELLQSCTSNGKPTVVLEIAWCRQAESHYLNHCWLRFGHNELTLNCRLQWQWNVSLWPLSNMNCIIVLFTDTSFQGCPLNTIHKSSRHIYNWYALVILIRYYSRDARVWLNHFYLYITDIVSFQNNFIYSMITSLLLIIVYICNIKQRSTWYNPHSHLLRDWHDEWHPRKESSVGCHVRVDVS